MTKKKNGKKEGKAQGLSFGYCYWHAKLYTKNGRGIGPYLYIVPFFLAYLVLDVTLRYTYRGAGLVGVRYLPACLFTLGWALLLAGLVFVLPKVPRWFVRCVPLVTCVVLAVTHSGFMSMFGRFFSFSVLSFGGTGEFFKADYIHIDWHVVAGCTVTVLLMMTSGRLLQVLPPRPVKRSVLAGLAACLCGLGLVVFTHVHWFPTIDTVIWENSAEDAPAAAYQDYHDTTDALMVSGLYQYTVRDLWMQLRPSATMSESDRAQVDSYVASYEAQQVRTAYRGALAGKNVIMVQLEATDTWMLCPEYMPNLARLKSEALVFSNHFTPAYISAGTFNTEFIVNTGLLPATGGISTAVYTRDDYPYSMASLFGKAGYTARSFHNSEGDVYDRGTIHPNLGYERYVSGGDMGMADYQMDRYLINGFDEMTESEPFFSFVITYSAHGPYREDSSIYQANAAAAQAAAKRTDGNYVYAVAGAMETDRFIGELVDRLTEKGLLDDTVLIFYADHYDYYMMDDALNMEIKGAENMDMLQHTDFFIWSRDLAPQTIDKVTSSVDVLPTVAELFALDTSGAFLVGHDALSPFGGGYVFFSSGAWYDGDRYWSAGSAGDARRSTEIASLVSLSNKVLAGNYYG